jgi:hypothetical protein
MSLEQIIFVETIITIIFDFFKFFEYFYVSKKETIFHPINIFIGNLLSIIGDGE